MNKQLKIFVTTLLGVLVFFVFDASAQGGSSEKTGALLWKISGNGLQHSSYVFGTHHLFPSSFLDSVAGVKRVFAESRQMVGEVAMHDMVAVAGELQRASMMPQDSTWQMLLSEEDYRFMDEQLTVFFGVGLHAFATFKPAMVSMNYTVMFFMRTFPEMNPAESIDLWFQQQAVEREIPVVGLETVHDQTSVLFEFSSLRRQAADLLCTLKNTEYTIYSAHKLNQLYRSADLAAMSALVSQESPCPMSAEQEAAINDERNRRWLKKLPALMAEKPSFIAVGALHLAGEAGILTGLEKLGYTVTAVQE